MKPEDEKEEKVPTIEEQILSLVKEKVEASIAPIRSEYEKAIEQMEEKTKKTISELEDKMRSIMAQMASYVCYNCHKDLISGKDAIYTNFEGHKFCSAKCIDEKKNETR